MHPVLGEQRVNLRIERAWIRALHVVPYAGGDHQGQQSQELDEHGAKQGDASS